jgi:hypothetical protein
MGKVFLIALGLLVLVVAGSAVFFAVSDMPPPAGRVEHVIPISRLPH